ALALPKNKIVGIEIEPDWAKAHPCVQQGDATSLPFKNGRFRWIVTSPAYGNRLADKHNAQERCKQCRGTGITITAECPKCNGTGRRVYKRITYRHYLGHELHPNNTGGMQWGDVYRSMHEKIW